MAASHSRSRWSMRWLLAWLLVGMCYAFGVIGIFSIGGPLVLLTIGATIVIPRQQPSAEGVCAVITGLGIPMFYMAFINRGGPGTICTTTVTGHSCVDESNPWPWVAVGATLIVSRLVGVVLQRRRFIR